MKKSPTALVILDGFGYRKSPEYNAIAQANMPCFNRLISEYDHAFLSASGTAVGLPANYMGNSEAGHTTIGAGAVIPQPLTLINGSIKNRDFFTNNTLVNALETIKKSGKTLHIIGLLSNGGIHSHIDHLFAFLDAAHTYGIKTIIIHPILDGRDSPPQSASQFLRQLEEKITDIPNAHIGSIQGRFYAMDRDENWQRTQDAYTALITPDTSAKTSWKDSLERYYKQGITDEFIPPTQLKEYSPIKNGDGVIFFNLRPERIKQLITYLLKKHPGQSSSNPTVSFVLTPLKIGSNQNNLCMFSLPPIKQTLLDALFKKNKSVFIIAETEKYAHVTYFFSGGREEALPNETRMLIPSIKAKQYVEYPCMSANEITNVVLNSLQSNPCDFYLINYANADMVGHSGNMDATIKAAECLDKQLKQLYDQLVEKMNGTLYITADHGNAEEMYDPISKSPKTSHTTNPVPFIVVSKQTKNGALLKLKTLSDIAPFILNHLSENK